MLNISQLLEWRANKSPDGIAILADQRSPATWNNLYLQAQKVLRMLRAAGIGRRDRVAIVSPNGPEMAVAFLTISSCAESAPLNPAYRANEFSFYLSDLKPKALIINGFDSPAEIVARDLGIPVIELIPELQQEAGMFTLKIGETSATEGEGFTQIDDVAIILHTSGTTSKPKIVPLTQANICQSASNIAKSLDLTNRDRCLNVMPLFHIHGLIGAVLSSTFAGASLVCTNDFYAPQFFEWIKQFDPTWYTAVPTMHQAILSRAKQNPEIIARSNLRFIRSSSAPLPRQVLHQLEKTFRVPVLEAFGMTEASHQISTNPLPPGKSKPGSVGLPAGPEVAIMNDDGELLERGEPGEIVIRGASVTSGYQNNPEANGSAFYRGWFRTGDEGYLDEDGYLFITCRKKEIINRGGEKISPYEVEDVFLSHPAIKEAVCFAVPEVTLGEEVGAAVVVHENIPTTELELREFASLRLSDFKIPRRVVFLKELPKSSTGKLQRLTLADQLGLKSFAEKSPAAAEFVSAGNPLEAQIAEIWKQILGLPQVGIHDNFFYLGGDSILATRIVLQIHHTLQREISLLSFFENPTIAELAGRLKPIPAKEASSEISPAKPCLSFAQEQMFFFTQVFPDGFAYNRPAYLRLRGSLNYEVLERCLSEIVRRHDPLRTTIQFRDNCPSPVVLPPSSVLLEILNLTRIPEEKREAEFLKLAIDETRKPFNLQIGPLYRIGLVKLSEEDHVLQMTFHHITFDDWSMNVLLEELSTLYRAYSEGRESPLPELAVRYSDFAQLQRTFLQGEAVDRLRTYWRKQLANYSTLHFSLSRPRPRFQTFNGARQEIDLSADLADALRKLAREEHVTLFMLMLASFQVLVGKYTEQTDISIGTPARGRNQPELENLIGVFINMIVLRTDLSGDPSFLEFLKRVRDVAVQAYAHQDLPFPMVVEELRPKRDLSMSPLFQITFQLRNDFERKVILSNQEMVEFKFDPGIAPMDLTLEILNRDNHLSCLLIYNTALFDASDATEILRNYEIILKRIATNSKDRLSDLMRAMSTVTAVQSYSVAHPEERISSLPLLTEQERNQLIFEWNNTAVEFPRQCIPDLFEAQTSRTPDATALIFENQKWTYRELNERANQLAHSIRDRGIGPEQMVGLCLERSPEMIWGMFGILKAGGAYIPLDPADPKIRLKYMLEEAQPGLVLTQKRLDLQGFHGETLFLDGDASCRLDENVTNPKHVTLAGHLAYAIYTSGSTGKPKAVLVTHDNVVNYLHALQRLLTISTTDIVLMTTPFAFDASGRSIFGSLGAGAALWLPSEAEALQPWMLASGIREQGITCILSIVPTFLRTLVDAANEARLSLPSVRLIVISGEPLLRSLCEKTQQIFPNALLINKYGPTECTMTSTYYRIPPAGLEHEMAPIGKPLANCRIYVLDRNLEPMPVGIPGELHIGGSGVSRGYLNLPDLTKKSFIPDPFLREQERIYKTGDLVRYRQDGNLEFLGRIDQQLKVHGVRIEAGEVETALEEHDAVKKSVVVSREDRFGEKVLVAYILLRKQPSPSLASLRNFLRHRLPGNMIPSHFVFLNALPLTPSGKIDRRRLPPLERGTEGIGSRDSMELHVANRPRSKTEEQLLSIWSEVLDLKDIGTRMNFFDIGGHSLSAMQILSRIHQRLGVDVTIRDFFDQPTIAGIGSLVDRISLQP